MMDIPLWNCDLNILKKEKNLTTRNRLKARLHALVFLQELKHNIDKLLLVKHSMIPRLAPSAVS